MDAYDIFKKLTKGIKFSRTNKTIIKKNNDDQHNQIYVKKEVDEPQENLTLHNDQQSGENDVKIFNSSNIFNEKRGKKRKYESEENLHRKKKLLETERINHFRNINHISVVGKHIPEPAYTFDDFGIDKDLRDNLRSCGYSEPTPIQKQAVPIMLKGQNVLACAPTGSGKTAAFLVPLLQHLKAPERRGFRAIILCPTRELAKQTQRECVKLAGSRNFKINIINKIKKALEQYGPKSNNKFDILVTTPKRLCFLLDQDTPAISLNNVEWVIIDEADKLFEEGTRGFREQLDQIMNACTNKNRKVAMFSATCTPVVSKWCVRNMKPLARVTVGHRNSAADTVDQKLLFVGDEHGKLITFREIVRKGILAPVLIFVQTKERAQELFNELIYDGIHVDAIHADRTQQQRDNTVKAFREGKIWVLICTELMARGVDFKGVNLVINYDFPTSHISYIHRIGRAGRAGKKGSAITFFTTEDFGLLRSIAHVLHQSGCEVPHYMLSIKRDRRLSKKNKTAAPQRKEITTSLVNRRLKRKKHPRVSSAEKNQEKFSSESIIEDSKLKSLPRTPQKLKKKIPSQNSSKKKQQGANLKQKKVKVHKKIKVELG